MPGKRESEQPRDPDNGGADLDENTHKGSGLHGGSQSSSGPREEPSEFGRHKDFVSINVDLDSLQPILGPEVQNPSSVKDLIAKRFDVPENNPILVTLWMSQKLRNELRWAISDESLALNKWYFAIKTRQPAKSVQIKEFGELTPEKQKALRQIPALLREENIVLDDLEEAR